MSKNRLRKKHTNFQPLVSLYSGSIYSVPNCNMGCAVKPNSNRQSLVQNTEK